MKCLSCLCEGKHFKQKICPECRSKGVTRDDITVKKCTETFSGPNLEASKEAAKFTRKMQKERATTRFQYEYHEGKNGINRMKVIWYQYERKSGGSNGKQKARKGK